MTAPRAIMALPLALLPFTALPAERITLGTPATFAPYVPIFARGAFQCGGVAITPNWVLTAGHCIDRASPADIAVERGGRTIVASALHKHPGYNQPSGTYDHDIGLIEVSFPLGGPFARLPERAPAVGALAHAFGRGRTGAGQPASPTVLVTPMTIVTNAPSAHAMGAIPSPTRVYAMGHGGPCQGDSGGPLVVGHTVVGLTSATFVGCPINSLAAFTSVAAYRQWIEEITWDMLPTPGIWWEPDRPGSAFALSQRGDGKIMLMGMGYSSTSFGDPQWSFALLDRQGEREFVGKLSQCWKNPSSQEVSCHEYTHEVRLRMITTESAMLFQGPSASSIQLFQEP